MDKGLAAKWYQRAAKQGLAEAQLNLGLLYYIGEGVPMDKGMAAKWFHRAAAQGHAGAKKALKDLCGASR